MIKKIIKITLFLSLAGVFVWTIYFLYQKSETKPVVFTTKQATKGNIIKKTVATGSINPKQEINVKSQVSGILEEIFVEPGNKVKKGDLIARIRIIPNMAALNQAENRLTQAEISFNNAKLNFDRQKQLHKQGVIADSDFQNAELTFKNAELEVSAAKESLEIVKEGATKKSSGSANTLIRSTASGMVLAVPVKEGFSVIEANNFNEGTTIATIADMQQLEFVGKLDESEVGKIKEGMPIELTIGALETEKFNAVLKYISPKGVTENGAIQFEIKADVNLSEGKFIRAGYSANGDIILDRRDSILVLEESLLQFEKEKPYVEVETGNQIFEKRDIKTGLSDGINIEILSGITKDDKIKVPQIQLSTAGN